MFWPFTKGGMRYVWSRPIIDKPSGGISFVGRLRQVEEEFGSRARDGLYSAAPA